jgi:two-component system, NtrC family, sensor histidine kinase HydH
MAHNLPVHSTSPVELTTEHAGPEFTGDGLSPASSLSSELPHRRTLNWIDALFLLFVAGLAVLPPVREPHKQLILAAIALLQLFEARLIRLCPRLGPSYSVILKILLATILLDHTGGEIAINSSYWPIYFLPVVTAATYFNTWATLAWTGLASAAYCAYLIPALQEFFLTNEDIGELVTRLLFLFLAAMLTNRFAIEIRRRAAAYQTLAEQMAETNRRLAEVQEEARRSERLAALGQMSAGLAHEIRNPLGVIKGSAEMLTKRVQGSNPLAAELAGYISTEVNRLSGLVARFLDFARPQALELVPGNVSEVVDRALAAVTAERPDAKVVIERRYTEGLPQVRMDDRLAEQVFHNLALNAYEAMEPGGGILRVEISDARREAGEGVEVTLLDSGPGIPPEISEQIFNPFFTTKKTGVGLGLAIVSKIVDEHHGSLRLVTELGRGACFRVFFPSAEVPAPAPTASQSRTS